MILNDLGSHCAFSGKARRFPKMMKPFGYRTVVYANAGSEVPDAEAVVEMMTDAEFKKYYPKQKPQEFHGDYAHYGTPAWAIFDGRLRVELAKRLGPRDLILHPFGHAHRALVQAFPNHAHIESGLGYTDSPFGAWRIYESNAWLHWHLGRWEKEFPQDRGMAKTYSFVVGNYFDLDEWPFCPASENEDYVLFLGRITEVKGTRILAEIIRMAAQRAKEQQAKPLKFKFAGQGDFEKEVMAHVFREPKPDAAYLDIEYLGPVTGRARATLVGRARCCILASQFIEPFGGSVVEAMLTGTPAIGPAFGAFRETIIERISGYTCVTLGDWLAAIEHSKHLDRLQVARVTRSRFSLEACGREYDRIFRIISDQYDQGWNTPVSHRIGPPMYCITGEPEGVIDPQAPARSVDLTLRPVETSVPPSTAPAPAAVASAG